MSDLLFLNPACSVFSDFSAYHCIMSPEIPTDRTIYEGEIATYWFEDEILVALSKPVSRTVGLIRGNVGLVKKITNNKPVPLLIYLTKSPMPDKETRAFSAKMVPENYSAMAMVAPSGLASFIMKTVFMFQKPPIPVKSFRDHQKAKAWLKTL